MFSSVTVPGEDLEWRVSRFCDSGACVGVARKGESILIANTSIQNGPVASFSADEWQRFIAGVKQGDFDGMI